ncbi:MAG: methionine--tRNA ligase, partial [Spirochaetaceae bacterium]|nr:methionine--tRNA ligase [Spirochaetaceae bacterium]
KRVDEAGFIKEDTIEQLYCEKDDRFLADRYVHGTCPHCGYEDARGDQCENCGKLLDPTDLESPRCGTCGSTPIVKSTSHLYLDLPGIKPMLEEWINETKVKGFWANNAVRMTESWIRDGLKQRAITRDLKWGIPVPKPGYEDKVFYVWFDAPIGYISITADLTDNWEYWWRDPDNTELFQFIGKDNIPFHTVIFPSTQLASGEVWTKLHHMSSSEYLNYEDGKFSKSKGVGVFGNDCRDTGIPADVWRFYIYYNRPENSDYQFTWADFQEKVNGELIGNFANLVNRTLSFLGRFYDGRIPEASLDESIWSEVKEREAAITAKLDRAELRGAFRDIFALSDFGNKRFQAGEPWRTRKESPEDAAILLKTLAFLVRDLSVLIKPFMPATSRRIAGWFGLESDAWDQLGAETGPETIGTSEILFEKLDDDRITALRDRFSGSQADRKAADEAAAAESAAAGSDADSQPITPEASFAALDLRAARITSVEQHPNADKLYVITLDDGSEEPRTICSGLVGDYAPEELDGQTIVLAYNLKPAKLRGIKSHGMLLAAEDEEKHLEVIMPVAEPGERVSLHGSDPADPPTKRITIDRFFETAIHVRDGSVMVGETPLELAGSALKTSKVLKGKVG